MFENCLFSVVEMEIFARNLKKYREARGLNQSNVAGLLSISPRVYNRWERGIALPRLDTIVKLADIFHVTIDELAGRKEPLDDGSPRLRNPKLHQLYNEIDKLSMEDQQALVILIDSLVKRSQINSLMGK